MKLIRLGLSWALIAVAGLLLVACGEEANSTSPSPEPVTKATGTPVYVDASRAVRPAEATADGFEGWALERSLWDFGLGVLTRQAARTGDDVVVSPVSLSAALSMTMNGTRGETADQMRTALTVGKLSSTRFKQAWADLIASTDATKPGQARIADSLWLAQDARFVPSFLKTNHDYYAAELLDLPADLSVAPAQINDWVARCTGGRIKDLVSSVPAATRLVLVNTVFVKVGWEYFDEHETAPADFTLGDGSHVNVPTMHGSGAAECVDRAQFTAVRVDTNAPHVGLWVIVPKGDQTPETVARSLQDEGPGVLERDADQALVDLRLPRFRVEYTAEELPADLAAMGMPDAFDSAKADFSGMTAEHGLCIADVIHKAMIDVNERGVEAAAGSAVVIASGLGPTRKVTVRADRPFLAVLTGPMGAPLFMTVVRDPR
jgi:serpin B